MGIGSGAVERADDDGPIGVTSRKNNVCGEGARHHRTDSGVRATTTHRLKLTLTQQQHGRFYRRRRRRCGGTVGVERACLLRRWSRPEFLVRELVDWRGTAGASAVQHHESVGCRPCSRVCRGVGRICPPRSRIASGRPLLRSARDGVPEANCVRSTFNPAFHAWLQYFACISEMCNGLRNSQRSARIRCLVERI
jgi:hypothetical protein